MKAREWSSGMMGPTITVITIMGRNMGLAYTTGQMVRNTKETGHTTK